MVLKRSSFKKDELGSKHKTFTQWVFLWITVELSTGSVVFLKCCLKLKVCYSMKSFFCIHHTDYLNWQCLMVLTCICRGDIDISIRRFETVQAMFTRMSVLWHRVLFYCGFEPPLAPVWKTPGGRTKQWNCCRLHWV